MELPCKKVAIPLLDNKGQHIKVQFKLLVNEVSSVLKH